MSTRSIKDLAHILLVFYALSLWGAICLAVALWPWALGGWWYAAGTITVPAGLALFAIGMCIAEDL